MNSLKEIILLVRLRDSITSTKKNFIKDKEITVNKYFHFGIRRIIDAIFTLGTSESLTYIAYMCPNCKELTVVDFRMKL